MWDGDGETGDAETGFDAGYERGKGNGFLQMDDAAISCAFKTGWCVFGYLNGLALMCFC